MSVGSKGEPFDPVVDLTTGIGNFYWWQAANKGNDVFDVFRIKFAIIQVRHHRKEGLVVFVYTSSNRMKNFSVSPVT